MTRRKRRSQDDAIMAAILAQRATIVHAITRSGAPASAFDDIMQDVLIKALLAARRGGLRWWLPADLRGFLRVLVARVIVRKYQDAQLVAEPSLNEPDERPSVERLMIGKETLATLRAATTPERWRAILARAKGISVAEIAAREGVPAGTIYTRLRLARQDFAAALAREDAAIYIRRRK